MKNSELVDDLDPVAVVEGVRERVLAYTLVGRREDVDEGDNSAWFWLFCCSFGPFWSDLDAPLYYFYLIWMLGCTISTKRFFIKFKINNLDDCWISENIFRLWDLLLLKPLILNFVILFKHFVEIIILVWVFIRIDCAKFPGKMGERGKVVKGIPRDKRWVEIERERERGVIMIY